MIDYRELLLKYINLAYDEEDTAWLKREYPEKAAALSAEEWAEIEKLMDEARKREEAP